MRRLLAAFAIATLVACDSFNPLVDNTVTGTWRGTSAGQTFVLALSQAQNTVAGSGTVTTSATGDKRTLSVAGSFNQPNFTATLTPTVGQPITLQGTVEGRSFVGTLTGGGFSGDGLALLRD